MKHEAPALRNAALALRVVAEKLPFLAALAWSVRVRDSARIPTACVFASGTIAVNPTWFAGLSPEDAQFVLAHELMHLALRTHERGQGADPVLFNIAHDAVINDFLESSLGRPPPEDGVRLPGARARTAESLLPWATCWEAAHWHTEPSAGGFSDWMHGNYHSDVLPESLEALVFGAASSALGRGNIEPTASRASWDKTPVSVDPEAYPRWVLEKFGATRALQYHRVDDVVIPMRARCPAALLTWVQERLEHASRSARAWSRPSRRGSQALPGRRRHGAELAVLIDTSSSMVGLHEKLLGTLSALARDLDLEELRVVQSDGDITRDQVVFPRENPTWKLLGRGDQELVVGASPCSECKVRHAHRVEDAAPTQLCETFSYLEENLSAGVLVVLTDAQVRIPEKAPRLEVAFILGNPAHRSAFPWGFTVACPDEPSPGGRA